MQPDGAMTVRPPMHTAAGMLHAGPTVQSAARCLFGTSPGGAVQNAPLASVLGMSYAAVVSTGDAQHRQPPTRPRDSLVPGASPSSRTPNAKRTKAKQ